MNNYYFVIMLTLCIALVILGAYVGYKISEYTLHKMIKLVVLEMCSKEQVEKALTGSEGVTGVRLKRLVKNSNYSDLSYATDEEATVPEEQDDRPEWLKKVMYEYEQSNREDTSR